MKINADILKGTDMAELKRYHEIPGALHIGNEKPRAYFIPFEREVPFDECRDGSAFLTNLCGKWSFKYFESAGHTDFESPDFLSQIDERKFDDIDVPGCWQLNLGRGYDVPNYINQDYPYPVDPPHLPDIIPCGLYRRSFDFEKKSGKEYFIHFEGVSSCFYLWINGIFASYSQVSHATSITDISDLLRDGSNEIDVLVVKHCDGSYLEDQDFFRLSGIFREVYILERDKNRIEDIETDIDTAEDFSSATVKVTLETTGSASAKASLFAPDGRKIALGEGTSFAFEVKSPSLWSPEVPSLYTLKLECGSERISLPIGIKRFEIKDSCVYLNGLKVKAYGINRHDSNPETGYTVTREQMLDELYILKRANVNTIRTSHYPNAPEFLTMCDILGFMVVDEADIECHGMGYNYGDWYWDYWAHLSDIPEWRDAYLDRAALLYERDKNHPCVIMWSLGNESGCGENHRAMAQFIRSRNSKAIIHYENARIDYQERLNKDFSDISDVESRMYAPLSYLREYLDNPELKKPFFYCEYVDSMSTGDIPLHWEGFEDSDKYFGGCVWEFCDHAVNIGTKEEPKYRYGGDFGDWPNDGICCIDGVVYPDRTPRPGYYDMKQAYRPFKAEYTDGNLKIFNKRYVKDFSDLYIEWTLENEGTVTLSGRFDEPIAPRAEKIFKLPDFGETKGNCTLNIYVKQKAETLWAPEGYETGFEQFILSSASAGKAVFGGKVKADETRESITVECGDTVYEFDKILGVITGISVGGKQLIAEPVRFNFIRCATYNSMGLRSTWKRARYDRIKQKTYSVSLEADENCAIISCDVSFAAAAMPPAVRAKIAYTFTGDGSVAVRTDAEVTYNAPSLPRFGIGFVTDESVSQIEYLGYGPIESYADRYASSRFSLYRTTAKEAYENYVKPQESSSHYRTRRAKITDSEGFGLELASDSFCFKAIPWNDEQLHAAQHHDELPRTGRTYICADYKIHCTTGCDTPGRSDRVFEEKKFTFNLTVKPLK